MSQEIELKLTISEASIDHFLALPILNPYKAEVEQLSNTYFDTAQRHLTERGAALRIRKDQHGFLQTLKTKGQNVGGLHQREEWETRLADDHLDLSVLADEAGFVEFNEADFEAIFKTDFQRTSWLVSYENSTIEVVLDQGLVVAGDRAEPILELELELKDGQLSDLFNLALTLSQSVSIMPSDISKAERGYRLCRGATNIDVKLPDIVPQQSMESAFCALFGYDMERMQRHWQTFWSTQEWRHLHAVLLSLGNMIAELEWFETLFPEEQSRWAKQQVSKIEAAIQPILSWWPACFALSKDAERQPESVAISLQQSKAQKALRALRELKASPELGHNILSLTAWLHQRTWREHQNNKQRKASYQAVIEGLDYCFSRAINELQEDCFVGSTSQALSQSPAVHRLLVLCSYFDKLYGKDLGTLRNSLQALDDNLNRLSAMEIVSHLKDWLNELPFEQQASVHSWTRSQTVLLRDIKQLASTILSNRKMLLGYSV